MVRLEHLLAASEIAVKVLSGAEAGDPKPDLGPLDRRPREIWAAGGVTGYGVSSWAVPPSVWVCEDADTPGSSRP